MKQPHSIIRFKPILGIVILRSTVKLVNCQLKKTKSYQWP